MTQTKNTNENKTKQKRNPLGGLFITVLKIFTLTDYNDIMLQDNSASHPRTPADSNETITLLIVAPVTSTRLAWHRPGAEAHLTPPKAKHPPALRPCCYKCSNHRRVLALRCVLSVCLVSVTSQTRTVPSEP